MQRTTYNERRYPFLTRKLRKRQTAKTAENRIDHPLLRRPGDAQNQTTNRGKPLPTLPSLYIPVTRPATPHPYSRGISSVIPFVENISSAYSSPSTLVQPGEPAFHRTPEWQEYRSSLTTSEGRPRAEDILIPAQPSPESSGADSDYPETSVERSSTAGLFYRRAQVAVHAIDTLQVIASNLEVLRQEDFAGEYREALERAHRYTAKVLQTLEHIPREVVEPSSRIRNFAEYLQYQIDHLRAKVINPENLSDPELDRDIKKLRSCLRARELHRQFLRDNQRV